jgi:hypothetical protein
MKMRRGPLASAGAAWPRSRALVALMAVALGLAGSACPRHVRIDRPYPPPPVAELRDLLVARQSGVSTIDGMARATSWLGGDRIRATVFMLVERGGRLRLSAEVALQGTVAVLATDGERFALLDVRKNELRRGPACPANIASLIRIPLGPADVAAIFLGDARLPAPAADPAGAASDADTVEWDGDAGTDVLVIRRGDGQLRYSFWRPASGGAARLVGAAATGRDGRPVWRVAFEEFVDVAPAGGGAARPLPQVIHYAEGSGSFDDGVEIRFKDRTLNGKFAADAFSLATPPGVTTIDVACP